MERDGGGRGQCQKILNSCFFQTLEQFAPSQSHLGGGEAGSRIFWHFSDHRAGSRGSAAIGGMAPSLTPRHS